MKQFSIEFKWAFNFFIASMLWMMIEKTLGYHDEKIQYQPLFAMIFGLVTVGIYILALREKKQKFYQNQMNWREGFVSGLTLSLVIALFTTMIEYTKHHVVSPYYLETMKKIIVEQNKMTLENADNFFTFSNTLSQSIFYVISFGSVLAAAISLAIKSKEQTIDKKVEKSKKQK
jgi:nitrate/nitrite transporter NarK